MLRNPPQRKTLVRRTLARRIPLAAIPATHREPHLPVPGLLAILERTLLRPGRRLRVPVRALTAKPSAVVRFLALAAKAKQKPSACFSTRTITTTGISSTSRRPISEDCSKAPSILACLPESAAALLLRGLEVRPRRAHREQSARD